MNKYILKCKKSSFLVIVLTIVFLSNAQAQKTKGINVAPYFQSGMVIQQNQPITVWGTAHIGTSIIAKLGNETKVTKTNKQGNWEVVFSSRKASFDILSLNINDKIFNNILIGEVWICSGQSNMKMTLEACRTKNEDLNQKHFDKIRFFNHTTLRLIAKEGYSKEELERCNSQKLFNTNWTTIDSSSVKNESAVAWYFASNLFEKLNVPIGIIVSTLGGSAINSWIPAKVAQKNPLTAELYKTDWLTNENVYIGHRKRGKDAFKNVLPDSGKYIINEMPFRYLCEPDILFESSIAKLQNVKFKGVVWYQGESDATNTNSVKRYEYLLPLMIKSWRNHFENENLPFIIIQLPRYKKETWPEMRHIQNNSVQITPNTSLVTTIDLGNKTNIHPKDKKSVGERVSYVALNNYYKIESPKFPTIKSHILKQNKIVLQVENVGGKLISKNQLISGFEIAGEDGEYNEVIAKIIDKNRIEIITKINNPKSIRYLWKAFPEPTIFNSNHLPLGPFKIEL